MHTEVQPILVPVKGSPDIVLSTDPKCPDELLVFLGLALLERVPRQADNPSFKMLLARLFNSGVPGLRLTEIFGVARSTLLRWGRALKSGDMDRVRDAFSGQGAVRKVTPEVERYVRSRFRDLYGTCRNYNQVIRGEVERYFKRSISCERLRWIFKEEREILAGASGSDTGGSPGHDADLTSEAPAEGGSGANSCEKDDENAPIASFAPATRNYSLQSLPGTDRAVPSHPALLHHAGILLMIHWIDAFSAEWPVRRDLLRQWVGQVLLGAVNHEQSKRLSFTSMEYLIGPMIRSLNHQRHLLGELASGELTDLVLERNARLLGLSGHDLFYFDPHAEEYTGVLQTLKGWSGGLHRVDKIINMDFIHTEYGEPCFVRHADNFYDMRERFFMSIQAFRDMLGDVRVALTWVADRGLFGLDTFRRIVDQYGDHFITWEKNYRCDGWDEQAQTHCFEVLKPRNNEDDLYCYRFEWQEHPWSRDPRFQRLIVRAVNPSGRHIEVAILTSDSSRARPSVIGALFNRWLQENDFGYMNRHMGINELTSRSHETYASIGNSLDDRYVLSREYKARRRAKMREESALKGLLLKREKQRQAHAAKRKRERREHSKLDRQISKLNQADAATGQERELRRSCRAKERLVAKHKANKDKDAMKRVQLDQAIEDQRRKFHDADKRMAESVRDESRLKALIDEQYMRLDTRRKAFMDAIRISCRNIFYKLTGEFRPLYKNFRDDHFIVRELTRAPGIILAREGTAHVLLMPTMQLQPASKRIVQTFLARMSQQINDHFEGRSMPIHIQLLDENSSDIDIDQHGLHWVSSASGKPAD